MIVYIDMDGVIVDYDAQYTRIKNFIPEMKYPQSMTGFFENMLPIDGAIEAVNKIRLKYDTYILSAPSSKNPKSYTEKRIWVEKYFDYNLAERLILSNYKNLLTGDYLIDDNYKGKGQSDFCGELILYGSSEYPNWEIILKELGV